MSKPKVKPEVCHEMCFCLCHTKFTSWGNCGNCTDCHEITFAVRVNPKKQKRKI